MQTTLNTLRASVRAQSIELLNTHSAAAVDLRGQFKMAHRNVGGPGLIDVHELFDTVAEKVEDHSDFTRTAPADPFIGAHPIVPALRFLVIEDDCILGISFAETVEGLGHTDCAIATSQAGAVDAAKLHNPDPMIVESTLSHGSGIDAVEAVLRQTLIPHVFITGNMAGVVERQPTAVVTEKSFRVRDLAVATRRTLSMTPAPSA
jgi:two-component system, response regulator PdtaR